MWLAYGLWRLLGLDTVLAEYMLTGREMIPWPTIAQILTIARFCESSSELHIEEHWYSKTALEDLIGVRPDVIHTDRLYAAMDHILPCKDVVEKHLKNRLGELFNIKYELFLYDVASTYFEGQCKANPLAKRGYSRDSRPDCLQVRIGLVVTDEGMPIGYEVFAGNTHDSKTVKQIVASMETKYGRANRVWVMDRVWYRRTILNLFASVKVRILSEHPKACSSSLNSILRIKTGTRYRPALKSN